jgi:invasion protein IalB
MRLPIACALAALLLAAPALAQTPPAQTPPVQAPAAKPPAALPVPTDPAQTTASYGDWVLRCVRTGESGTGPRACELVQTMVLQGQQQPIAQVALGYDKADLRLTLLVPPAISLSRGPLLGIAGAATPNFAMAWRRCLPNGCFGDVQVGPELMKILRSRTEPMQVVYKDAGERDVTLPFSFRGLVPALEALAKEPKQ